MYTLMKVKIKRVYDKPDKEDGKRILVDRLWPRGLTKEKADIDLWLKEVAPSTGLRKWFGHDPDKWDEFQKRYRQELKNNKEKILKNEKNKLHTYIIYIFVKQYFHNNKFQIYQRSFDI